MEVPVSLRLRRGNVVSEGRREDPSGSIRVCEIALLEKKEKLLGALALFDRFGQHEGMINLQIAIAAIYAYTEHGQGLPICWWGDPGIGKTAMLETLAVTLGMHCEAIATGVYDPSEFNGMAIIDEFEVSPDELDEAAAKELGWQTGGKKIKGKIVRFSPARWAREANEASNKGQIVLVFFDEITTAAPATQQALLRVLNERWSGDLYLGENVAFMLAANPASQNGGHELIQPVANRMGHIDIKLTRAHRLNWAKWRRCVKRRDGKPSRHQNSYNPLEGLTILTKAELDARWDDEFEDVAEWISDFIMLHPELLHDKPRDDDPQASREWASCRTWDFVTSALTSARLHNLTPKDTATFCSAFIGEQAWAKFSLWLQERLDNNLPDAAKFLDEGCKGFTHDPSRPDRTLELLESCTSLVCPPNASRRRSRRNALVTWMDQIAKSGSVDLIVRAYGDLAVAGLMGRGFKTPKSLISRLGPLLD